MFISAGRGCDNAPGDPLDDDVAVTDIDTVDNAVPDDEGESVELPGIVDVGVVVEVSVLVSLVVDN